MQLVKNNFSKTLTLKRRVLGSIGVWFCVVSIPFQKPGIVHTLSDIRYDIVSRFDLHTKGLGHVML